MAEAGEGAGGTIATAAAAGGLLSNLIGAGGNIITALINARENKKLWNLQNEYNTPLQQMNRYRAAGINPNMIYGNGSSSAGNAGAIAPFHAEPVGKVDLLGMANAISTIKNTDANARKAEAEAIGAELENSLRSTQLQYYGSNLDLQNRLAQARLNYITGQTSLQQYQREVMQAQAQNLIESSLYTKQNREVFQPTLLSLRSQEVANSIQRLNWDMSDFNPANMLRSAESAEVHPNAVANRISKYIGSAAGVFGSAILGLKGTKLWKGAGKLFKNVGKRPSNLIKL